MASACRGTPKSVTGSVSRVMTAPRSRSPASGPPRGRARLRAAVRSGSSCCVPQIGALGAQLRLEPAPHVVAVRASGDVVGVVEARRYVGERHVRADTQ